MRGRLLCSDRAGVNGGRLNALFGAGAREGIAMATLAIGAQ
jgi:hypothetical protein